MIIRFANEDNSVISFDDGAGGMHFYQIGTPGFYTRKRSALPYVPPSPPDPADLLAEARRGAVLTRGEFVKACLAAGILTPEGAMQAARAEWPAAFQNAISDWSVSAQIDAIALWSDASEIRRSNAVLTALASASDIPPEALDVMFGISGF